MKTVINLVAEPMSLLRTFKGQPIVMGEQFGIISRAHDRVTVLGAQVDACMGDNLSAVTVGQIHEEAQPQDNNGDWARPPGPFTDVTRPPEASPYE
jgi:hypothetical protein